MAFWILEPKGHGKFRHFLPKQISAKKAQELDDDTQIFDSRKDAQKKANELRSS